MYGERWRSSVMPVVVSVLGRCQIDKDASWRHNETSVLRLRDASGVAWFAKQHHRADNYAREVHAYRRWVRR